MRDIFNELGNILKPEKMQITDIFGNKIAVTDLGKAIEETKIFISYSKKAGENDFSFDEFKLIELTDQNGKKFRTQERTKSGNSVKSLQYYKHQLKELLNHLTNI